MNVRADMGRGCEVGGGGGVGGGGEVEGEESMSSTQFLRIVYLESSKPKGS